ncbi:TniQ family protein [Gorillibacterium massiliense]|uniref:TniQ family protein n=1 Tax=Gorillibacterium massiliense TaxID=1280390 RepID=UPI0004AF43BE|nr:TniQ family protein [Gorillibacterium massiliense]
MTFLIRPKAERDESLISYLYRLAKSNGYNSVTTLTSLLHLNNTSYKNNLFEQDQLNRISEFTSLRVDYLYSMTSNLYLDVMGSDLAKKALVRNKIKYCPKCLEEGSIFPAKWFLRSVSICEKHGIILNDKCYSCGSYAVITAALMNKCSVCSKLYSDSPIVNFETPSWVNFEVFELKEKYKVHFYRRDLPVESVHQLLYSSLLLLEGMPSPFDISQRIKIYHNKKGASRNNEEIHHAIISFFWMYDEFPYHFNKVLEHLFQLPAKVMYFRKGEFERLLQDEKFCWLREAYDQFWLSQLNNGRVRRDFSVFKENEGLLENREFVRKEEVKNYFSNDKILALANGNTLLLKSENDKYFVDKKSLDEQLNLRRQYVSKSECSRMLGLSLEIVREVIREGILEQHSIEGFQHLMIKKTEVEELIGKCFLSKLDESKSPIAFSKSLKKYNTIGLSAVELIKRILSGELKTSFSGEKNFKCCYLDKDQLNSIIVEYKEKRSVELGLYREEVMKILRVGEKRILSLEALGALKPKLVIHLKGGRKRYIYDKEMIFRLRGKCG